MRVAALYDIHGMLEPLQAVVRELEDEQFDWIVIGGDAISGPQPVETFEILGSLGTPMHWIRGNGERALGPDAVSAVVGDVEDALRFTASYFSDDQRRRLSSLPESVVVDLDSLGETLFCHASPRNDLDILTPGTPDARFRELLDGVPQRVIVSGHTHMQFDRSIDGVRWINPGSVGMPYEGEVAAFWALLGPDVELRRTPFDVERHMASLLASGWPEAKLFVEENVRAVLPREEAVRLFEHIAAERGER